MNTHRSYSFLFRVSALACIAMMLLSGCVSVPTGDVVASEGSSAPAQSGGASPAVGETPGPAGKVTPPNPLDFAKLPAQFPALKLAVTPPGPQPLPVAYHVIYDDNQAMKGFLAPKCTTYLDLLTLLDSKVYKDVDYFRLGRKMDSIEQAVAVDDAKVKSFYGSQDTGIYSVFKLLDKISKKENRQNVYVFISDMVCSSNNEQTVVATELMNRFINAPGKAMVLLGWPAEYSGTITNIVIDKKPKKYEVNGIKDRPVYMMIFGDRDGVYGLETEIVNSIRTARETGSDLETPMVFSASGYSRVVADPPPVALEWDPNMLLYTQEERPEFVGIHTDQDAAAAWAKGISFYRSYLGVKNDNVSEPVAVKGGTLTFTIPVTYENPLFDDGLAYSPMLHRPWKRSDITLSARQLLPGQKDPVESTLLKLGACSIKGDTVEVPFTIDVSQLDKDIPAVFSVTMTVKPDIVPNVADDVQWLSDWTMDMEALKGNASFHQTGKTPYLKDIFVSKILEDFAKKQSALDELFAPAECGRITFGFVFRDVGPEDWDIPEELAAEYKGS